MHCQEGKDQIDKRMKTKIARLTSLEKEATEGARQIWNHLVNADRKETRKERGERKSELEG